MEVGPIIVFVGILIFAAHLFAAIFSHTKIPDVLLLIIVGLVLGPFFGLVSPEHFGAIGPIFTTITLVVILFEGGIGLDFRVLLTALRGTLVLTVSNFLVTMLSVAAAAYLITGMEPLVSLMLGAIVGSISPAVVVPMVRELKLQEKSRTILFLESALSDVLSIVVALAVISMYRMGKVSLGPVFGQILASFLLASLIGMASAFVWSILLNKVRSFQNSIFTTPAFVFVVFGIVETLGYSGYIASLAFGVTLGNIELVKLPVIERFIPEEPISLNETEKVFFSEVVFILRTFFFVYVGVSMQFKDIWSVVMGLCLTILIFLVRVPAIRFTVDKSTSKSDASFMAVMAPKGLAAAVLASIPLHQGVAEGETIQNITYAVVLFSILLTSVLVFLISKTRFAGVYERAFSRFGSHEGSP